MPHSLLTLDATSLCGPTSALNVEPKSVHVWAFSLEAPTDCLDRCHQTLCAAEQSRAARFIQASGRNDYVVAHGVLRELLGRYTGRPAKDVAFTSDSNGKPQLFRSAANTANVSFNLTHSHRRALIAISDGREVGIDLEKIGPKVRALAIARRYFCAGEIKAIEDAAAPLQAQTFYRYWVAKEATLKGQGIGVVFPIDRFEVQFDAHGSAARIRSCEASRLDTDWTVQMLPVEADWVGAVAVRGLDWTLALKGPADARERAP